MAPRRWIVTRWPPSSIVGDDRSVRAAIVAEIDRLGLFRVRLSSAPAMNFYEEHAADDTFVGHDGTLLESGAEAQWDVAPEDDDPAVD